MELAKFAIGKLSEEGNRVDIKAGGSDPTDVAIGIGEPVGTGKPEQLSQMEENDWHVLLQQIHEG